jgi:hypothetical protein
MSSNYPSAVDSAATLYTPVDAFSTKPLQTTTTASVGAGDSTISVQSTVLGFADVYGVLSIDDELVIYTAKTGSQFTGCQRGAFGTAAASHANGVTVRGNMVAGFITALQSAVVAIETELGTAAARNYVRKDGAVTITGVKNFQDGVALGTGNISGTGLMRLPNLGAIKWRKADNSGDLGMALNASNHIAVDAVIDFAAGQTFGAFSHPDATTTSKGIVQIDPVGGLAITAGVASLAATSVTPGTYTKLTVDSKGRATAGAGLVAADLPAHTHVAGDIVSGSLPYTIQNNGTPVGNRRALNLAQGTNVTLSFADDSVNDRVTVTVAAAGGGANHNLLSATHPDTVPASPVLGDLIAANGTPAWARLAGQTTTTRKFLRQTGTGSVSALPSWDTLADGDLPTHSHAAEDINSGTLALARGGAAADLSATGPGFLKQASAGAAVTVAALAAGDIPNLDTSKLTTGLLALARGGTGASLAAAGPGFLKQASSGAVVSVAALVAGDLPTHTHAESDVTNLVTDLSNHPVKGGAWAVSKAAVINSSGQLDGAAGTATDCVLVNGTSAAKANAVHTHAESDVANLMTDLAGKAASIHAHTSSQISDATAAATASTVVLRDGSAGANFGYVAANNIWAFADSHLQSVECGAFQTVGAPYENMLKYSEDFSVGTWDKNGGTCTVSANAMVAPDGNQTANSVTASGAAGLIRQNIAGLVANGQYTFYVWLKVPSGTMTVSLGILDNGWTTWLVGPTAVTLTTSWQRFRVTGTMTGGATSLWVAIGHYTDGWTAGLSFHAWGACLQQGNDPKKAYARTWGYQASPVAAGVACGTMLVVAKDSAETPFRVTGPGSNLADHTLLQVNSAGELTIAGGAGNGYMFSALQGASNPSGWSGVIKVKSPAGVTAGYILLYSNP